MSKVVETIILYLY